MTFIIVYELYSIYFCENLSKLLHLRRFISIALVLLVSWQTLAKLSVFAWYLTNKTYIATTLCVNRNKPEMHCNGKCVLMQRLKAVEEERREAQERPLRIVEKLELSHFIIETLSFSDFPNIFSVNYEPIVGYIPVLSKAYLLRILQPPELPFLS